MSANRYDSFLKAVLGNDGAGALIKATEQVEDLSGALVPRTILAWLGTKLDGHDGSIPGTSSYFAFAKSESGYVGAAEVGNDIYTFEKADLNTVAAHLAVSLGVDMSKAVALKHVQAERLGRSIDILAKAQSVQMNKADKGAEAPGPAHAPTQPGGPSKPTAPTPTQPNIPKPAAPKAPPLKTNPMPPLKPIKVKLPGKKLPGLSITKSESLRSCSICGTRQFSGSSFVGCTCLSSLAKSVSVASTPSGYNLSFSGEWDRESILSLAKILGVR